MSSYARQINHERFGYWDRNGCYAVLFTSERKSMGVEFFFDGKDPIYMITNNGEKLSTIDREEAIKFYNNDN